MGDRWKSLMPTGNGASGPNRLPAPKRAEARGPRSDEAPADSLKGFTQRILLAVLIMALAYATYRGVSVLLEAFAGILFAVYLAALTDLLSERTGIRYRWSLVGVVLFHLAAVGGGGYLLANRLSIQIGQMSQELPQSLEAIREYLGQYAWGKLLLESMPAPGEGQGLTLADLSQFTHWTGLISDVGGFLEAIVVIFFVGVFGAAEPGLYKDGLLHVVPFRHRPRAGEALEAIVFNLRWWLLGQVFLMLIIGITTTVSLWLLGIPLALTLGIMAGILELIPYLGAWIAAVPAAMIALLHGPHYVLLVGGLYLFLHILEGYVLLPLIQRRAVKLPPALTLVGQILLGRLLGMLGLFVAAPLTVVGVVLAKMLYVEDTLGDESVDVPGEPGNEQKPAAEDAK